MELRKIKRSSMIERAAYRAASKVDLPQRVNRTGMGDRADKPISNDYQKTERLDRSTTMDDLIKAISRRTIGPTKDEEEAERTRRQRQAAATARSVRLPNVKLRGKPILAGNDR